MNYFQSNGPIWPLWLVLAFVIGCGGKDEKSPDDDVPTPVSPQAPQTASDLLAPGEAQLTPPGTDSVSRVEFQTSEGTFTVTLHRERVPNTVKNFLDYVDSGYYNGTIFHEVTPGYAVVAGKYTMDGDNMLVKEEGRNPTIRNESENAAPNKAGTIGMAREPEDADSARCQFYFNLTDNSGLDYRPNDGTEPVWQTVGYCVFGEVEGDGLKVLEKIASKEVTTRKELNHVPVVPITIIGIRKL